MVPERRQRRTQAERTAATRGVLLDATLDCLVELGYRGVTTAEVAHRAGVSIGALQHHFPTKADLGAAAVEHVFARRQAEFAKAIVNLDASADRMDAAVDVLWSMFSGATFVAWLELWVAARTDADLAEAFVPVDEAFSRSSRELFAELFADLPGAEDSYTRDLALTFTYKLLDGLALGRLLGEKSSGSVSTDEVLLALKTISRLLFPR